MENKDYKKLIEQVVRWMLRKPEIQQQISKQIQKEYRKQMFKHGKFKTKLH